jgi:RHS repeat-associated protein
MGGQSAADLISLPQGGGAMRGLGETFSPDLHTGTGNLRVPLTVPAGRAGVQPALALAYSTGSPNGPFGLGWALDVPGIRRKTAQRLPRYDGTDVFVLSGSEDLVPVPAGAIGHQHYRPRSEGLFARIVRHAAGGQDHWEVRSSDGLRSRYGTPRPADAAPDWRDPAAVCDPAQPARVLGWMLSETVDPLGNRVAYRWLRDGDTGQLYLREVAYVDLAEPDSFLVAIRLVYTTRPDPFVDRRGGFALQTRLRCRRIETLVGAELVRSVQLRYADEDGDGPANGASLLTQVQVVGHAGENTQALPPLELGYTPWTPEQRRYRPLAGAVPVESLARGGRDLVDLFGDGLPSVLELGPTARYWRNRGDGRFDSPRPMRRVPDGAAIGNGGAQLADMDGDGRTDLLLADGSGAAYFPLSRDGGFDSAVAYAAAPSIDLADPELRLVDLDGDGVVDALRAGGRMETYFHDRRRGWTLAGTAAGGPPVSFADPRVKLADMTGDGLTDIVLVTSRRVTYWPNLGYGRWGAPVAMAAAPPLADPEGFDAQRVLLGDIDGDGCADLVYIASGHVTVWVNQAGTRFSEPDVVRGTPAVDDMASVRLADMLGTGTAGILWTFDAGTQRGSPYKFLDLTGGTKPYLLTSVDNHMGARTAIAYASSTEFALADAEAGRPWRTSLPFPMQVVARTTITDHFSRSSQVVEYRYHHGHWDGAEREFRGFGRVDQLDAQEFTGAPGETPAHYSPPLETRTWFHLGPVGPEFGDWRTVDLSNEHWPGDPRAIPASDLSALPEQLSRRGLRDAVRSLAGRILRTELYARDGDPASDRPYTVSEHGYAVLPVVDGLVTVAHTVAERATQWERGDDPMTSWAFTGGHDAYGRPDHAVAVAVPRRHDPAAPHEPYLATITRTRHATRDDDVLYRTDRAARVARHQILNDGTGTPAELRDRALAGELELSVRALELRHYDGEAFTGLPFGELGAHGLPTRIEQLAFGPDLLRDVFGDLAAAPPYLTGAPATWPDEYPAEFRAMTAAGAGYTWHDADVDYEAGYYVQAERLRYDDRGLVVAAREPLGAETTTEYEAHGLRPVRITGPTGLVQTVEYDQRTFQPNLIVDANGNRTVAAYTPLGMLARVARLGQDSRQEGDTLEQPGVDYAYGLSAWDDSPPDNRQPAWVDVTTRGQHRWDVVDAERRRRSDAGLPPPSDAEIEELFADEQSRFPERFVRERRYADGMGRDLQNRIQFDAQVIENGLPGESMAAPADAVTVANLDRDESVVAVSGWRAYDNKGRVVRAWQPVLSHGWAYRRPTDEELAGELPSTTTEYDARGQAIAVTAPDGAVMLTVAGIPHDLGDPGRFVPTPWESYAYDANDNAGRSQPTASAPWSGHWNTPSSTVRDALGHTVRSTRRTESAALNTTTDVDVAGRPVRVRDELGRLVARSVYDLLGRTWLHDLLDRGATITVHDAGSGTVEQRDARGARTLAAYDGAHRRVRRWSSESANPGLTLRERTVYGEDAASGLTEQAAREARVIGRPVLAFDEAGLIRTRACDLGGSPTMSTRQVLRDDVILAGLAHRQSGWEVEAAPVDWTPGPGESFEQRAQGLLDPVEFATDASFDALNRRTTMLAPTDVDGRRRTLRFAYGRSGALAGVSVDGVDVIRRIFRDARGHRALVLLGNGLMTRRTYDPRMSRLVRLRTEPYREVTPGRWQGAGPPLQDHGYRHDLIGNVLTLLDRTPGCGVPPGPLDVLDRNFAYDALYRLTSATGREHAVPLPEPWSAAPRGADLTQARAYEERYAYDDVGRLLEIARQAAGAGSRRTFAHAEGNRLASATFGGISAGYAYDAAGNVVREATTRHFEWDASGRLAGFRTQAGTSEPSRWVQYRYDADNRLVARVARDQGGAVTRTIYVDGAFERTTITTPSGTTTHDALDVADDGTRVARLRIGPPRPKDTSPPMMYQLTDHLGSVTASVDGQGAFYSREDYTPYGDASFGSHIGKRHRFTGAARDEDSGLSHHGARQYAPWLGRWTSCDPAGLADGSNLYAYARGNPVMLVDPAGTNGVPAGQVPDQWELVQQSQLRQKVTATATTRGISQTTRGQFQELFRQWQLGEADVGHSKPFALTKAGETDDVFAQARSENRSLATQDKAAVAAAKANGDFHRVGGVDKAAIKGTRFGQPPESPALEGLEFKKTSASTPKPATPPVPELPAPPKASAPAPTQLELPFDAPPKTAAPPPKTALPIPSAPPPSSGFGRFLRMTGSAIRGLIIKYATQKASEEILERAVGLPPDLAEPMLSQLPPGADVVVAADTAAVGWLGLQVLQEGAYELRLPTDSQGWVQMP